MKLTAGWVANQIASSLILSYSSNTFLTRPCVQTEASSVRWFSEQTSDKCTCDTLVWLVEPPSDTRLQRAKQIVFIALYIYIKRIRERHLKSQKHGFNLIFSAQHLKNKGRKS